MTLRSRLSVYYLKVDNFAVSVLWKTLLNDMHVFCKACNNFCFSTMMFKIVVSVALVGLLKMVKNDIILHFDLA